MNISGGNFSNSFEAGTGSTVSIQGGTFGTNFRANNGSNVEFVGGEFMLNGNSIADSNISLDSNDVFTGTFADGSAFIFSPLMRDELNNVALTPSSTPLPPIDTTPIFLSTESSNLPGLRTGQTLTIQDGGRVGNSFAVTGATLNIEQGGRVGSSLETSNAEVNISGGRISSARVSNSVINMSDGIVFGTLEAFSGTVVNMSGGQLGSLIAHPGSELTISGGIIGHDFQAPEGSEVEFIGGEFQLNGADYTLSDNLLGHERCLHRSHG